jgi:hypothetical protein
MWIMKNSTSLRLAEFEIFYLCLAKDNILSINHSSIKEASVVEEEKYHQNSMPIIRFSNGSYTEIWSSKTGITSCLRS